MSFTATFHAFPRLPAELRSKIWESAIDTHPAWITVHIATDTWKLSYTAPPPAVLYTTRESRNIALKHSGKRKYCIGPADNPATIYFSSENDVLDVYFDIPPDTKLRSARITWPNLDSVLHNALRATQHLHLRARNINALWELWDIGDFPGGPVGLDDIFTDELLNLKIITESEISISEIHVGEYEFCPHVMGREACPEDVKCLREFEALRPTMVRSFKSFCNEGEEEEELQRGVRWMVLRGRLRLPLDEGRIRAWDEEYRKSWEKR